jgi:hypothetical protein
MESDEYCRDIEAHLCRRNGGHLVRLVGPAFDMVQAWFQQGIPFKVACQGIDRRIERAEAKAGRRRPVRLEFCEADVLDAFDAWRRAVGVRAAPVDGGDDPAAVPGPVQVPDRTSLPAHLARVIARLTALRAGAGVDPAWSDALDAAVRQIDALQAPARAARGEARTALLEDLARIDAALMADAWRLASGDVRRAAAAEAEADLAPFRGRLPETEFEATFERGCRRALRGRLGLPEIARA